MAEIKKDLRYFMVHREDEVISVPAPETFKDENGETVQMEIKVLTQEEINAVYDKYRRHGMATDKKGNPIVNNGEVVFKTERDNVKALKHLIVEALVYPDLKDKKLMEFYDCVDVTDMPMKVFAKSDEFNYVQRMVLQALGITTTEDDTEAAKN